MDENQSAQDPKGISRRRFIGALGGGAAAGREDVHDAIYQFQQNNFNIQQERRISGIPLYNNSAAGCTGGSCPPWQVYQPFVLHTADDISSAPLPPSAK